MIYAALWVSLANAQPTPALTEDPLQAEYHRRSSDLASLAKRNAWEGVERAYQDCQNTGLPLSFDDQLIGAHAASERGDLLAVRERLASANRVHEDRTVIEWMWSLDNDYVHVTILGDLGTTFVPESLPFDPVAARAVSFARARWSSSGHFEGLLPEGAYYIGDQAVVVHKGGEDFLVDVRKPVMSSKRPR